MHFFIIVPYVLYIMNKKYLKEKDIIKQIEGEKYYENILYKI